MPNPRWERCPCQTKGPNTFRPTATWLKGRTSPERLYLETKWSSLVPYEKVADLLKEVLPVSESTNHETVREHLQTVAERIETELGEERQPDPAKPEVDLELPLPDGSMTAGLDGGYVRAAHKEGFFEVIAGRSVVAFRRREEDVVPPPKCFGFVQTYDQKPRPRLWELMKSQGMQENQQVVFLSDGGEGIRKVREYLHPNSEHVIDWFHITMRLTVLQQQAKTVKDQQPESGAAASKQLESIKHLLWHGNAEEALERLNNLFIDLDLICGDAGAAEKLAAGVAKFIVYIRNNQESIPNYGERYRQGGTISTAFVESTINQVVSRRFVKRQQMHWTLRGAHLLLQTRTKIRITNWWIRFGDGIRSSEFKRKRHNHRIAAALQLARRELEEQADKTNRALFQFVRDACNPDVLSGILESAFFYYWLRTSTLPDSTASEDFFQKFERHWEIVIDRAGEFAKKLAQSLPENKPALPGLVVNSTFMGDFLAADPLCFALGMVEEETRRCGYVALRFEKAIPRHIMDRGFDFGHGLLGTSTYEVMHFILDFSGVERFNALVNPNNSIARAVLNAIVESGDYFFFALDSNSSLTAFRSDLGGRELNGAEKLSSTHPQF